LAGGGAGAPRRRKKELLVSWKIPEKIKLRLVHTMDFREEVGLTRMNVRETERVVQRPEKGELRVAMACGHCGREGVFVIHGFEATKQLRRGGTIKSLSWSAVLLTTVLSFWIIGLTSDDALFLVLAIPASLLFLPPGIYLACSPSGKIGVEMPKDLEFKGETVRKGLTLETQVAAQGQGLSCNAYAFPVT
jgi:hypothetical protein